MKLLRSVLTCGLAALASASPDASVFTFPAKQPTSSSSLSLEDARLFLAHRLGLSKYYDLGGASDQTLDLLNGLGNSQALFSNPLSVRRTLILVEGLDSSEVISNHQPQFQFSSPADLNVDDLVDDLLQQDQHRRSATASCGHQSEGRLIRGGFSSNDPLGFCPVSANELDIIQSSRSSVLKNVYKKNSPASDMDDSTAIFHMAFEMNARYSADVLGKLKQMLSDMSSSEEQENTIVVIPQPPPSTQHRKRNSKRGVNPEAPLSVHAATKPKPVISAAKNGTAPKTTIPFCWASEQACNEKTQACMGHGACRKKYTEKVSSDEDGPECWACLCSSTVLKLEKGATKTTHWGGPACQKKDISVPFFLFAGFTMAAVALVSWGIGMLYSIGQQDLPSVLGAGVAPPPRK